MTAVVVVVVDVGWRLFALVLVCVLIAVTMLGDDDGLAS